MDYRYYRVPRTEKIKQELEEVKLWSGIKTDSKALEMLVHFGYKWFNEN